MVNDNKDSAIQLENISKSFYGVEVLRNISLDFKAGEVHVICGENGAGKSTLIKIIAGFLQPSSGIMRVKGKAVKFSSPKEAEKAHISVVPQEICLCPTVSVAENIFLSREFGRLLVNKRLMRENAQKYMDAVGLKVSPDTVVKDLSLAEMQMVQIAKALSQNPEVLILDEPCSSLTEDDSEKVFSLLLDLKSKGVAIIYIDHRIDTFRKIADKVTVLRDGELIGTLGIAHATRDRIIQMMVGRELSRLHQKSSVPSDKVALRVENLTSSRIKDISFSVHEGEVFGLAGLVGAGRSEIIRAIFGVDKVSRGKIIANGIELTHNTPEKSIKHGIGYVPEDRKLEGLVLEKSPSYNITLTFLDLINKGPFVSRQKVERIAQKQIDNLKIKILDKNAEVAALSGGNQQKILIAKWLINNRLKIALLDEPTRGIDVGVKAEIYRIIDELAQNGVAIVLVTSELQELMDLSDRIAVVNRGRIVGILAREEFSQEAIMHLCV